MFDKILIANRGEIACRIIETAHRLGVRTVAIYSDADRGARHVRMAHEAHHIGAAPAAQSYLRGNAIIEIARATDAQAIHPGYGLLSENAGFAKAVRDAGLAFIGPDHLAIEAMGLKDQAKALMVKSGVPVVPGYHGPNQAPDHLLAQAEQIGFPVLVKARAGGGGKGMRLVNQRSEFHDALGSAQREAKASFGDDHVLIEKYISKPRHIEVQIFGDQHGQIVHLFERDCSLQRRHQKVIEEAPAPGMTEKMRTAMTKAAIAAGRAVDYQSAGTVEFIVDGSGPLHEDGFWFMEMNTRLQVEHPVTEAITGQDLVEWQLRVAAGEPLPVTQDDLSIDGHAIEARIYAEDPSQDFKPSPARLQALSFGKGARIDTGVSQGDAISAFYDPMIAKLIVHAQSRDIAIKNMSTALEDTAIIGPKNNVEFLTRLNANPRFISADLDTGLIAEDDIALTQSTPPTPRSIISAISMLYRLDLTGFSAGFYNWTGSKRAVPVIANGTLIEAALTANDIGLCLQLGDEFYPLSETGNKIKILAQTDQSVLVADGLSRAVFERPDPLARNRSDHGNPNELRASVTGIVSKISIAQGDAVTTDQPLIMLEAMKMEHSLRARNTATLKELLVTEGQPVSEGDLLAVLEPNEKEPT